MKKIIYIILSSLLITACGDQEITQYDVNNGQTLIQFQSSASSLEVLIDSQGTVDIPISVSTFSDTERIVTVNVVPLPEGTSNTAQANQYSFDENVTIPANMLTGSLTVTGMDMGIEIDQNLKLQLKIIDANFDNISIEDEVHTINISQICPVPEDYLVGTYRLNSPLANVWCDPPRPSFIGNDIEVEVSIGDTPSKRVFTSRYTPGSCDEFSKISNFTITLLCGQAFLGSPFDTDIFCGDAEVIIINNTDAITNYDDSDDSTITINVIESTGGTCIAAPANQSFTLTKL